MLSRTALIGVCSALAASAPACTGHSSLESTASTGEAIEAPRPINDPTNPISSQFPLSTVNLVTPVGAQNAYCTGVILTPTKILTAAHCGVGSTTIARFYATNPGGSDLPRADFQISAAGGASVAKPPGVACEPRRGDAFPETCYSTFGSSSHYADLAVLTLSSAIPIPYKPVVLAARGSFGAMQALTTSWAVGTGRMDWVAAGCPDGGGSLNAPRKMAWAPIFSLGATDSSGSFTTGLINADRGDSGGPMFQLAASAGPTMALVVVGILSDRTTTDCTLAGSNTYTSVEYGDNYDWIVSQGGSSKPKPSIETFGASL